MSDGTTEGAVTGVRPGGSRRIDRVLGEDYLGGLPSLPLEEVRALREEADQEETDLSYLRRLLQARIDIVHAEQDRRAGRSQGGSLVEELPRILADAPRASAHGLGRHRMPEPTNAGASRRYVEQLVTVDISDVSARSGDELAAVLRDLEAE